MPDKFLRDGVEAFLEKFIDDANRPTDFMFFSMTRDEGSSKFVFDHKLYGTELAITAQSAVETLEEML